PFDVHPGLGCLGSVAAVRMAKRFTLEEAQRLIPQVERLLRQAITMKSEYDEAERAIQKISERGMFMGGVQGGRDSALGARSRRQSVAHYGRTGARLGLPDQRSRYRAGRFPDFVSRGRGLSLLEAGRKLDRILARYRGRISGAQTDRPRFSRPS